MSRSPLYSPPGRGGDFDAGGAADLQTDVMRFMAIIALCLVAIFALVQSLPLKPAAPAAQAAVEPVQPMPATEPERRKPTQPAPRTEPQASEPIRTPPAPSSTPPVREFAHAPAAAQLDNANAGAPVEEGFTLRFESDAALTRLVAHNEVGLYAIGAQRSMRMSVNRGSYSFWSASAPNQYHEMDAGTVPAPVVAALRRSGPLGLAPAVKWGVTLPAGMQRQLGEYLAEHSSGALVIEGDGNLRLEP